MMFIKVQDDLKVRFRQSKEVLLHVFISATQLNRSPQSKVTHSPDWRAQHRSNGKVRASFGMHLVLLMRPTYADGNDTDVNRFKRKYQRSRRCRLTGAKRTLCGNADISVSVKVCGWRPHEGGAARTVGSA